MTNYKEILRLKHLGLKHTEIASSCGCGRNTVTRTLLRAQERGVTWSVAERLTTDEVRVRLFPPEGSSKPVYKMPNYEWVHSELQKSGVTLSLLWVEYCERCRTAGELPYQSTQFNKYYAEYVHKTKATMHLTHKPGETMQVDWAGQTAHIMDTDTGKPLDAYLFVAVLPYSGYAYVEAFWDIVRVHRKGPLQSPLKRANLSPEKRANGSDIIIRLGCRQLRWMLCYDSTSL